MTIEKYKMCQHIMCRLCEYVWQHFPTNILSQHCLVSWRMQAMMMRRWGKTGVWNVPVISCGHLILNSNDQKAESIFKQWLQVWWLLCNTIAMCHELEKRQTLAEMQSNVEAINYKKNSCRTWKRNALKKLCWIYDYERNLNYQELT